MKNQSREMILVIVMIVIVTMIVTIDNLLLILTCYI